MKEYWLYTDEYPGDYQGQIPDDEWAICEFEYGGMALLQTQTAIVTKVLAAGSKDIYVGFEGELHDDAITDDPHRVLKFLFDREFYK